MKTIADLERENYLAASLVVADARAKVVAEQINAGPGPLVATIRATYVKRTRMGRALVLVPVQFRDPQMGDPFNLSIWAESAR